MVRNAASAIAGCAVLLLTVLALCGCAPAAKPVTFSNPIVPVGQDPFVTQWGHRYLLIEERGDNEIWIRESKPDDLTGIAHGSSHRVWVAPTTGSHCTDVWAPELHHIGGHWYIYYSATTCDGDNAGHRNFVLESSGDDPIGSYLDRGQLGGSANAWATDGTEFAWHSRRYFVWSGWPDGSGSEQDLFIARMSSPTALGSAPVILSRPTLPWERHGAPIEEGPESLTHGGRMFLVYSASGSWTDDYRYGLLRLTGSNPLDPTSWAKAPRSVFASANGVYGPGHGSFVRSPDGSQSWMIYHSAIAQGSGWDRQVDAQPFTWKPDGSPDFGAPRPEDADIPVPAGQR